MKFNLGKIQLKIKNRIELFFLLGLFLITVITTKIYNLNKEIVSQNYLNLTNNIYFQKTLNHIFDDLKPKYTNIEHKIINGETFNKILEKYEVTDLEIKKIKSKLSKSQDINNLKTGQIIEFTINEAANKKIEKFLFPVSRTEKLELIRNIETNNFNERKIITNLTKKIIYKEGKILKSLYRTALDLRIQPNIIIEFARIYGFQIDFQRDIRKNDTFQIMYEIFVDDNGKVFETGNITYADLQLRNQKNALYYFSKKDSVGHYDSSGRSIKKALMKSPINGARLSSSFGMRKHPIDGFNKMHKGTDFAAPLGTPIMASGDGVVVKAKWCGGGGNCIKIKHNSTYSTVYAHMSKFISGIKVGMRVKQGQVIGFVGSTGKSTGPHLHYEVIENKKKIDSQKLKLPSGKILKGKNRELFEIEKIKRDVLKSELIIGLK
jgi:murein DD-endopeptidase MepM/ murein hydrolase activator NlpD